jgi:hypothetical protein
MLAGVLMTAVGSLRGQIDASMLPVLYLQLRWSATEGCAAAAAGWRPQCIPCCSSVSRTWFLVSMGSGMSRSASIRARGWSSAAPAGPPPAPVGTSAGTVSKTQACMGNTDTSTQQHAGR